MVRSRKPVRGGRSKGGDYFKKPKKKKEKFNLYTKWYIKERNQQNQVDEEYRKHMEEKQLQKKQKMEADQDSEDEIEENPLNTLLSTFDNFDKEKSVAIYSDTESESEMEVEEEEAKEETENCNSENERLLGDSDDESDASEKNVSDDLEDDDDDEEEEEMNLLRDDDEDAETAREDAGEVSDPFSVHLRHDLDDELYKVVSSEKMPQSKHQLHWPALKNAVCLLPKIEEPEEAKPKKTILLDTETYAKHGQVPKIMKRVIWDELFVPSQIHGNLSKANEANIMSQKNPSKKKLQLTELQKELFSIINNYQDLFYSEKTFSNADEIRFVYSLHAVNHILKTRTRILHHNSRIQNSGKEKDMAPEEFRDQGLVRPKVLIVVPFKHSCLKIVENIMTILFGKAKGGSVVKKKRFLADFSGDSLKMPRKKPKPEDYEQTFKGQTDDSFKISMSFTKKTLKLYTDFYSSDIIISSPLGLRRIIGAEGENHRDYDFLASIELLIFDQTEILMIQNWDHVLHIMKHIHLQPKSSHDSDFSRLRSWCANGWTKYYRQTLIFSSLNCPEIQAIFNQHCRNYAGKVQVINPVAEGSVSQVMVQHPLMFERMRISNHLQAASERLNYFTSKVLPHYKDRMHNHTLIYIPSYFDFVTLRNYFRREGLSNVSICEFTKPGIVAKARDMFFHSTAHFLLYTERAHFFFRYRIKGIRRIIFYAPPLFPHFYSEMCNLMQEGYQNYKAGSDTNMSARMIYSKYDFLQLSAIVGTERAQKMLKEEKHEHMLMMK